MFIHADFSQPVIIKPEDYHWVKPPGGEVDRMMLDRIGDEKARATSLVKYAPESAFPEHQHPLGEEVLILSGILPRMLKMIIRQAGIYVTPIIQLIGFPVKQVV